MNPTRRDVWRVLAPGAFILAAVVLLGVGYATDYPRPMWRGAGWVALAAAIVLAYLYPSSEADDV